MKLLKLIGVFLLTFIVISGLLWIIAAFVSNTFDSTKWDPFAKTMLCFIVIVVTVASVFVAEEEL